MPRICYKEKNFGDGGLAIVHKANEIIEDYAAQGYDLTLRQLYYQFVARDLIENKTSEYKRLGSIINDARLAGLIDWNSIIDRTRNVQSNSHWNGPKEIVEACAKQYQIDKWLTQECRVEVWIEKDALVGVIENVCRRNDVSFFSCRGYTSQSEMWSASQRLMEQFDQRTVIIHLGDHDPSGMDMSRDIQDRLDLFMGYEGAEVEVHRIALNMNQVEKYNPPPNPAKITDSRAEKYIRKFGGESWELDALEPRVLEQLIEDKIQEFRDDDLWEKRVAIEKKHIATLSKAAKGMK
jgi:hypothetical protein